MMTSIRRVWRVLLLLALIVPLLASSATTTAQGFVVDTWKSPSYGFTVEYRTDVFSFQSQETTNGVDSLELTSDVGGFFVQALPASMTIDQCAQMMIDQISATEGDHEVLFAVQNGTALIRSTRPAQGGQYSDFAYRIDCIASPEGDYLVRFIHFAAATEYDAWEPAADDIRTSYRPGYPANNPLPSNITQPYGELEVVVFPLKNRSARPADIASLYQPTSLLTVEFIFTNVSQMDSTVEAGRIIIDGVGRSVSHAWTDGNTLFTNDDIMLPPGVGVIGHLTFAIPATMTVVTFCYQHITDENCASLGTYDLSADTDAGGPASRPRINPGT